jgi:hypothetical protein
MYVTLVVLDDLVLVDEDNGLCGGGQLPDFFSE